MTLNLITATAVSSTNSNIENTLMFIILIFLLIAAVIVAIVMIVKRDKAHALAYKKIYRDQEKFYELADLLLRYKQLLDSGAISQSDFERMKAEAMSNLDIYHSYHC